jgi:hypothetical protein
MRPAVHASLPGSRCARSTAPGRLAGCTAQDHRALGRRTHGRSRSHDEQPSSRSATPRHPRRPSPRLRRQSAWRPHDQGDREHTDSDPLSRSAACVGERASSPECPRRLLGTTNERADTPPTDCCSPGGAVVTGGARKSPRELTRRCHPCPTRRRGRCRSPAVRRFDPGPLRSRRVGSRGWHPVSRRCGTGASSRGPRARRCGSARRTARRGRRSPARG